MTTPADRPPRGGGRLHPPRRRDDRLGRPGARRRLDGPRRGRPPRRLVPRLPGGRHRHPARRRVRRWTTTPSPPGTPTRTRCRSCSTTRRTPSRVLSDPHIGDVPLPEAVDRFYTADVFMHTWDLARATGQDETLDAETCAAMLAGMEPMDEVLRSSGQYGPRVEVPDDADLQTTADRLHRSGPGLAGAVGGASATREVRRWWRCGEPARWRCRPAPSRRRSRRGSRSRRPRPYGPRAARRAS